MTEIIVTARRVEERLQDVPISITVFNQEQLANRNITTAQDIAAYTPSLSARNGFGSQYTTYAIRGFTQESGTQPSVGVYFADVVAPRGGGSLAGGDGAGPGSFFDLENVQVLKGPQGTLFGRNTTGGAVLLVPRKPTSKEEGYVEASYGNYDMKRIQAVYNAPLNDIARFRIGLDHQSREGYVKNTSGIGPDRMNDLNYTAARASLVLDVTPKLENYSIFSLTHSNSHGDAEKLFNCNQGAFLGFFACAQLAAAQAKNPNFYTAQVDFPDPAVTFTQWQLINTTTWQATDALTVKNIASYGEFKNVDRTDLFGTFFQLAPGLPPIAFSDVRPGNGRSGADQSTLTEELQFQGHALDQRLIWQAGGYFEYSRPIGPVGSHTPLTIACSDPDNFKCIDLLGLVAGFPVGGITDVASANAYKDFGIYAQGTYSLTEQLKFTAGIRYTHDLTKSTVQNISYRFLTPNVPTGFCSSVFVRDPTLPITSPADCTQHFEQKSSAPTWLLDLDYKPTDDLLLYAKYARGYREGSTAPTSPDGFNAFAPEKVNTYEGGLKATFGGPIPGTFNVAAFYNDFTQQQLQVVFFGPTVSAEAGIVNAGKSRMYGAEVETSLQPFKGFTLNLSYAYLNTRVQSITIPPLPATSPYTTIIPSSVPGDVLSLTPKNKIVVSGDYRLPLPEDIGGVSIGATFAHTSQQLVDHGSPFSFIQPTNLLDMNLNWTSIFGRPVDLSLFATNLTNKHYFSYVSGLYTAVGWDAAQLAPPRMYGVRLRARFGS